MIEAVAVGAFILAGWLLFLGIYWSRSSVRSCDVCRQPMPDGYWAAYDDGFICRRCGKRLNVRAWYAKRLPNGKWIGEQ